MITPKKTKGKQGNKPASPDKPKRESSIFIRVTTKEKEAVMGFTNFYLGSVSLFLRMAGRNFMIIHKYAGNKDVLEHIKRAHEGKRISEDSLINHSREVFEKYVGTLPATTDTSFLVKLTEAEFCEYAGVADFLGMSPGMYLRMCSNILLDENQRCPEVKAALEILNPSGMLQEKCSDSHHK